MPDRVFRVHCFVDVRVSDAELAKSGVWIKLIKLQKTDGDIVKTGISGTPVDLELRRANKKEQKEMFEWR